MTTIKLLEITNEALSQYREEVNGNKYITLEQAQRKLTRNVKLVRDYAPERVTSKWLGLIVTYSYGNLDIVVKRGKVISIVNNKGQQCNWHPNKQEYIRLCKQLGIEDNKFKKVVYK